MADIQNPFGQEPKSRLRDGLVGCPSRQGTNHKGNSETSLPKVRSSGRLKGTEPSGRGSPKDERDASLIPLLSDGQ